MTQLPDERWAQIDALFGEALELPADERLAFLESACAGDRELFDAVLSLLDSETAAGRFIGEQVADFAGDVVASLAGEDPDMVGAMAGPYRLVRQLGRGGMGTVYLAERADGEFDKRVALKLVKRGMDTDEILRRFHFERRILAALEHPNIARLYDGGATSDGRPFLVMELVEGERITDFCDARRLTVPERLELFRAVCAAVQYAHQKLVVHRDIKPSNILVTADGMPKLLDFGIATLLGDDVADAPHTRTGVRLLTPDYAAPEQVRGEAVTTATDVHALGAVLYEMLTGRRAFRGRDTAEGDAMRSRPLRRPSNAVAEAGAGGVTASAAADAARARRTEPARLQRTLRGDLDTIVMKALEEDPAQRYPSVQQLLDDLDRYGSDRPIMARPASAGYRAGRFFRRHQAAIGAAAVMLLTLAGGLAATLVQAQRAALERDRAEQALAVAESERDAAEQVTSFLEGMFAAANPFATSTARMDTLRIGAFLDSGADRLATDLADRPLVRARMLGVLGRAYRSLGAYDRAEPLLAESLDLYREVHGEEHVTVAAGMNALGNLYLALERPADAEQVHRRALAIRQQLLGGGHSDVAQSMNNLASALQNSGRLDEAEPLYDQLLGYHETRQPPDSAAWADAMNTRMMLAYRKDDVETALRLGRQVHEMNVALFGEAHPRSAQSMNNLGQVLVRTGAAEEAEPLLRRSLELSRDMLGDDHPNVAAGTGNLAGVLRSLGRLDEADSLYAESVAATRRLLGNGHPALAVALSNHADLFVQRGNHVRASALQREALDINRAAFGPAHMNVGIVTGRLAATLCKQGRNAEGAAMFADALAILRGVLPPGHSRIEETEQQAGDCAA